MYERGTECVYLNKVRFPLGFNSTTFRKPRGPYKNCMQKGCYNSTNNIYCANHFPPMCAFPKCAPEGDWAQLPKFSAAYEKYRNILREVYNDEYDNVNYYKAVILFLDFVTLNRHAWKHDVYGRCAKYIRFLYNELCSVDSCEDLVTRYAYIVNPQELPPRVAPMYRTKGLPPSLCAHAVPNHTECKKIVIADAFRSDLEQLYADKKVDNSDDT